MPLAHEIDRLPTIVFSENMVPPPSTISSPTGTPVISPRNGTSVHTAGQAKVLPEFNDGDCSLLSYLDSKLQVLEGRQLKRAKKRNSPTSDFEIYEDDLDREDEYSESPKEEDGKQETSVLTKMDVDEDPVEPTDKQLGEPKENKSKVVTTRQFLRETKSLIFLTDDQDLEKPTDYPTKTNSKGDQQKCAACNEEPQTEKEAKGTEASHKTESSECVFEKNPAIVPGINKIEYFWKDGKDLDVSFLDLRI
ncbi:hypothetical protein EDC01DRAFT_633548 [Geopyxis carbonaria]|nr:hypothetical protein EDC01DRAFT_633548 [Geopyxis carbonaria]